MEKRGKMNEERKGNKGRERGREKGEKKGRKDTKNGKRIMVEERRKL